MQPHWPGTRADPAAGRSFHSARGDALDARHEGGEAVAALREQALALGRQSVVAPAWAPLARLPRRLQGAVRLVGPQTRAEIASLLAGADVLVAPSVPTRIGKREGIPVVLMEAMSCGIPVVASRLSGIPELVADGVNGLLVEPGRPDQLASALRALARDGGLRARLGAAGRERVCREFDLDRTAGTLAAAFARSAAA